MWTPVPLAVQIFNIHMNLNDTMNIKTEINTCFITLIIAAQLELSVAIYDLQYLVQEMYLPCFGHI